MFRHETAQLFDQSHFVRSLLTGTMIAKESENFRHEQEVEFLSSLSSTGLEVILTGFKDQNCHRSLTAVRGPAEVRFLRAEIALFRAFSNRRD